MASPLIVWPFRLITIPFLPTLSPSVPPPEQLRLALSVTDFVMVAPQLGPASVFAEATPGKNANSMAAGMQNQRTFLIA